MAKKKLLRAKTLTRPQPVKSRHDRHSLRAITFGEGLPSIPKMREELQDYWDVLLGRKAPPVDAGIMTLQECANGYYVRAMELTALLQREEANGRILKGSAHYKYRTGELRTFCDAAKYTADLGSRRLTEEQLNFEKARMGRESYG